MNYIYDPKAGRYGGDDPYAARAFREIQRVIQELRADPIYKITKLLAQVGSYQAIPLWGKPTADGIAAHPLHFGMQTDGTNAAKLLINLMESPTNAAHALPLGAMLEGSRRLHYNGQDCIFVNMPPNAFSGSNGGVYIDPGPDGGPGGGGGDGGGGGGDGPGGGGGGGGPLGGGSDGMCPLSKIVVIADTFDPAYSGSINCVWTGGQYTGTAPSGDVIQLQGDETTPWAVTAGGGTVFLKTTGHCPPGGPYTISSWGGSYGALATCNVG